MTTLSYEFFPPRSLDGSFRLWDTLDALRHTDPSFVSVTYGASGTTRDLTHEAVQTLQRRTGLDVAAHLTCVAASQEETLAIADSYAKAGVSHIVALRGDPPKHMGEYQPQPDGFATSIDLVEALAKTGKFDITVGAYPDPHPEAAYRDADIDWLKRKVDAGANRAITQFFFQAETFFRFREKAAAAGISIPILPGILPIQTWEGTQKMAVRCGAVVPKRLAKAFEKATRDGHVSLLALAECTHLCSELIDGGVDHLHFYTLNDPTITRDVVHALGLAPEATIQKVA